MENEVKCWCQHCGIELPPSHTGPCPKCGKSGKRCEATSCVAIGLVAHANSRIRNKGIGYGRFKKETLQGHFASSDPKLKNGVDKIRIIDKEKNEYHETTKDSITGELTRDIHEPLNQHKHVNKLKQEEIMGSKGRKNVKKPKQVKGKAAPAPETKKK